MINRKNAGFLVILGLLFAVASPHASAQVNRKKPLAGSLVHKLTKSKSAWIVTSNEDNSSSTGTGVLIDAENLYVLTAAHVIDGAKSILVFFPDRNAGDEIDKPGHYIGSRKLAIQARTVAIKKNKDLGLLQLEPSDEQRRMKIIPELPMPLATQDVEIGQAISTLGSSGANDGILWRLSKGDVRHLYEKQINYPNQPVEATILEMEVPINPGDSGGPVVSEYGVLVGVNSGTSRKDVMIQYAINRSEIQKFLEDVPFPICASHLQRIYHSQTDETSTYIFNIYGNDLKPRWSHTLEVDQGIRVISSKVESLR